MRAIIVATGQHRELGLLGERHPAALLPLVDRPFVQHVVELLVGSGVATIDLVVAQNPERFDALLGDGARWGCMLRTHLARDPARPYGAVRIVPAGSDEAVLLVHADRIPTLMPDDMTRAAESTAPLRFDGRFFDGDDETWTGWAALPPSIACTIPARATEGELAEWIAALPGVARVTRPVGASAQSPRAIIESQRRVFDGSIPSIQIRGRIVAPGVHVSRGTQIHPSARLTGPVSIGSDCRIGAGAFIGPNAVLGDGVVVDTASSIGNALILARTYVGHALDVVNSVADGDLIVSTELDTSVLVQDSFLMSSLDGRTHEPQRSSVAERVVAGLLLVAFSPALLAMRLLPRTQHRCVVGGCERVRWHHFFVHVLPVLLPVVRGEHGLVGVDRRDARALAALPQSWREAVASAKQGVITESLVTRSGNTATADERYAAEAVYAARASVGYDARILGRYARLLVAGSFVVGDDDGDGPVHPAVPKSTGLGR